MNRFVIVPSLLKKTLFLVASGLLAASAQAQVSLASQTFDTSGATVPVGAGQTFLSNTGTFPVSNTNAATLFPAASSASSVAGGDAGTNYATFGGGSAFVARTNTITGLSTAGLFTVVYDTNLPTTGTGAVAFTLITAAAADTNGGTGTFTGFTLSNTGAVAALGATGVVLSGGTAAVPLGSQFAMSLLVNDTATAATYLRGASVITLPAFSADLYSYSLAGGLTYVGNLTSNTGTNATTNTPQQLGFRTFNGNTYSARFNELDVTTGLNIATLSVPEPSTYAGMLVALGVLALCVRSRRTRRVA